MNERISLVIVPLDDSPVSAAASRHAALLARLLGTELRLLHVMPPLPADLSDLPGNRTAEADTDRATRRQAAADILAAARETAESAGVANINEELVDDPALTGDPARAIVERAQAAPGCLLVIGSRGLDDLKKLVLDSTSHAVVHRAPCPVTLVHDGAGAALDRIDHIIAPVDGSEHSARAATLAGAMARAAGASVELLHVVPRTGRPVDDPEPEEILATARERLGDGIDSVKAHRATADPPATAVLERAAAAPEGTVIVMGRRGLGHLREHLLGSVSHRVLEEARCPVTVIT